MKDQVKKEHSGKTLLLFFSVIKSITIKSINFVLFSLQGLPPLLKLDFGLFSAVLLPLEPTILFSNWSAVSPSKSRDFRLYEPTILFQTGQRFPLPKHITSGCMSPRSLFPPGQRYPIPLPVMTSLDQSEASICAIRSYITTSLGNTEYHTNNTESAQELTKITTGMYNAGLTLASAVYNL